MAELKLVKVSEAEVQSSSGFSVKIAGHTLRYFYSSQRYLTVEANYVPDDRVLHVYLPPTTHWMSRGKAEAPLTPRELMEIGGHIIACMEILNLKCSLHWS